MDPYSDDYPDVANQTTGSVVGPMPATDVTNYHYAADSSCHPNTFDNTHRFVALPSHKDQRQQPLQKTFSSVHYHDLSSSSKETPERAKASPAQDTTVEVSSSMCAWCFDVLIHQLTDKGDISSGFHATSSTSPLPPSYSRALGPYAKFIHHSEQQPPPPSEVEDLAARAVQCPMFVTWLKTGDGLYIERGCTYTIYPGVYVRVS
eukprot:GHVS01038730.1.p1 GENE.GHVS01038730.1~~GHVS01038730.1.p1  ORF type:complete len:205 (+),score=25.42 GHVS01038730.1:71-685(+)